MIGQSKIKDAVAGIKAMQDEIFQQSLNSVMLPKKIGHLKHEPTGYTISVHKTISRFKRIMLKWCFGLKYEQFKQ